MFGFGIWSIFLLGCGEKENTDTELYCNGNTLDNLISDDADCDGVLTGYDCDDNDPNSTIVSIDEDCDGVLTDDDCDDSDSDSTRFPMMQTVTVLQLQIL